MAVTHRGEGAMLLMLPEVVRTEKVKSVVDLLLDRDFDIIKEKEFCFTHDEADAFFQDAPCGLERSAFLSQACAGYVCLLVLQHPVGDTVVRLRDLVGREDLQAAKEAHAAGQTNLRGAFLEEAGYAGFFCSACDWSFQREMEFFFPCLDRCPVERTFALIKPDAVAAGLCEEIEDEILNCGLRIVCKKSPFYEDLRLLMTSPDGVVAMILEGQAAIRRWWLLCGPTDSAVARRLAKQTLRGRFGCDATRNVVHGADCTARVNREAFLFFDKTDLALERTFALIKPDGMATPVRRAILNEIEKNGLEIIRQRELVLTEEDVFALYSRHRERPFFSSLVEYLTTRPSLALVLMRAGAVRIWRHAAGARAASSERAPRTKSLRGRFAENPLKNTVHAASSREQAELAIAHVFPELPVYPAPNAEFIHDYLFRKSAAAGKHVEAVAPSRTHIPPTLQLLISKGLEELCAVRPTGLEAVSWLADWLEKHAEDNKNPGKTTPVELPEEPRRKVIVVSKEAMPRVLPDALPQAPFFVRLVGAPFSGKKSLAKKLAKETGFLVLDVEDLVAAEITANSALGALLAKAGGASGAPAALQAKTLCKAFSERLDNNCFILLHASASAEDAKAVDRELGAEPAFTLFLDCPRELLLARAPQDERAQWEPKIDQSLQQLAPLTQHYERLGRLYAVAASRSTDEVFRDVRALFLPALTYLFAAPGLETAAIEAHLARGGAELIDVLRLLREADNFPSLFSAGAAPPASAVCPLVVDRLKALRAKGRDQFVITNFPSTLKQAKFLEAQVPCTIRAIRLVAARSTLKVLAAGSSRLALKALETQRRAFASHEMNAVFADLEARGVLQSVSCDFLCQCPLAVSRRSTSSGLLDAVSPCLKPRITLVAGLLGCDSHALARALCQSSEKTIFLDVEARFESEAAERASSFQAVTAPSPAEVVAAVRAALHHTKMERAVLINLPEAWRETEFKQLSADAIVERLVRVRGFVHLDTVASGERDPHAHLSFVKALSKFFARELKVVEVKATKDSTPKELAEQVMSSMVADVVAVAAPPTVETRALLEHLQETFGYKLLPDMSAILKSAKKGEKLPPKKLAALLENPDECASCLSATLATDPNLRGSGCILIGFPNTVEQAAALIKHGVTLQKYIQVDVDMETVLQRLQDEKQGVDPRDDLEGELNAYYAKAEALGRFFEARGQLVKLADGSPGKRISSVFTPRVFLFPSSHLKPALAQDVSDLVAKKRRAIILDVNQMLVPELRGNATAEDILRDLATVAPRDLLAHRNGNADIVRLISEELQRFPMQNVLICGFPFAPLDAFESGGFGQLLQLKEVCEIQGLVLLDVPASAFGAFGCACDLIETLGLSVSQVIQHSWAVNDLLLSFLGGKLKDEIRLTLQSDDTIQEIKRKIKQQLQATEEEAAS
ncbi:hypothetical protein BESB_052280 [Besnoitia besnoiti]|uniref:Nucleoside diphosphate kinase-like domain-containing protein n=1 Tax=Besnoitia besnoiti TaxID=94643 RepID=A0A2A9MJ07_BESBE|nr:hypothetical protein BESB_052280 [Besnoitia besnoiti]PFH35577.1 hypothetical protein BESB_052280 [Besnoitia besnoiti]